MQKKIYKNFIQISDHNAIFTQVKKINKKAIINQR